MCSVAGLLYVSTFKHLFGFCGVFLHEHISDKGQKFALIIILAALYENTRKMWTATAGVLPLLTGY